MNVKLLLVFLIALSISDITLCSNDKRRECKLEQKVKIERRSTNETLLRVYLDISSISIEQDPFMEPLYYTIIIKSINTGEITTTISATGNTYYNINNLEPGEYYIEIDLEDTLLYGSFTIFK